MMGAISLLVSLLFSFLCVAQQEILKTPLINIYPSLSLRTSEAAVMLFTPQTSKPEPFEKHLDLFLAHCRQ